MKTILLSHGSGWLVVHDNVGYPSSNYCVFKATSWDTAQRLPSHGVSYCSTLESALCSVFQQLIIENVTKAKNYQGSMLELRGAIVSAHADFKKLLSPKR